MTSYYIASDGKQTGPFEVSEILRRIGEGMLSSNDLCWRQGMADWQPLATVLREATQNPSPPPIPAPATHAVSQARPLFLYISTVRLILMSIVSLGIYEWYWTYKNWCYVKQRENLTIRPFWRAFFGYFYCYSLLRRIHDDKEASAVQVPTFSPGRLATGWIVLTIIAQVVSRGPDISVSILAVFIPTFLCLVPVQNYVNAVTKQRSPDQRYNRWSRGHVVCLVIGIIVWTLLLIEFGTT